MGEIRNKYIIWWGNLFEDGDGRIMLNKTKLWKSRLQFAVSRALEP
jgi:hypothetical protein